MDSPTDRPTDNVETDIGEDWSTWDYLSIRITFGHENVKPVSERLLGDLPYWLFYMHGAGKQGDRREHFHICIPVRGCDAGRESDKLRLRIKRLFKLGGNKDFSIMHKNNGLHSFIYYCSHDEDKGTFSSGDWSRIFEKNREVNGDRKYVKMDKKRHFDGDVADTAASRKERYWMLTYTNLVKQAVLHTKRTGKDFGCLKFCVKDMIKTTNWRPSKDMVKKTGGVPHFYEQEYVRELGKTSEPDMDWWDPS